MSEKKDLPVPDYEALTTTEQVDQEMWRHKDALSSKVRSQHGIAANRKEMLADINEQLKFLKEEIAHEVGVLGALDDRRRFLHAMQLQASGQGGNVVPIGTAKSSG